jgi:putative sigma-54 modulation protein
MKVIIQSPDFKATKRLQKFVVIHVQKLGSFYNNIVEGRVCLKTDNAESGENKICELQVAVPGNDLFASKRAVTFEESVTRAIDAVKHQMEKRKTAYERQRMQ